MNRILISFLIAVFSIASCTLATANNSINEQLPENHPLNKININRTTENKAVGNQGKIDVVNTQEISALDRVRTTIEQSYEDCAIVIEEKNNQDLANLINPDLRYLGTLRPGVESFMINDLRMDVAFQARKKIFISKKRIYPKSHIEKADFSIQEVNVAAGQYSDLRGVLLSEVQFHDRLESRRSIIEGQALTVDAIQKIADAKRGDRVSILLNSNGLTLTAPGALLEDARSGERVRAISYGTKKEFNGLFNATNHGAATIEVNL
jgi:flagella basal body P-ring formation protein FlgA